MADEPKKTKKSVAVAIWHGSELLILFRKNKWDKWILPSGGVNDGEDIVSAAMREIEEEAAIDCYDISIDDLYHKTFKTEWTDSYQVFEYECHYKPNVLIDLKKFSGYLWFDVKNSNMVQSMFTQLMPGLQLYLDDKLKAMES